MPLNQSHLQNTLITVFDQIMPAFAQVEYRLVGTGAALLHGVPLPARDIDLLVKEREAVDLFSQAMASFKCFLPPTLLPENKQYHSSFEVNGVEIGTSTVEWETASDGIECFGPGPWKHFVLLPCGNYLIPTVALELRLVSELFRGRPDRYNPLIKHMQLKGCDLDLLCRGMKARRLLKVIQEDVLNQLSKIEQ